MRLRVDTNDSMLTPFRCRVSSLTNVWKNVCLKIQRVYSALFLTLAACSSVPPPAAPPRPATSASAEVVTSETLWASLSPYGFCAVREGEFRCSTRRFEAKPNETVAWSLPATGQERWSLQLPAHHSPVLQADGGSNHGCVVLRDGSVWCWHDGELPTLVQGLTTPAKSVAWSSSHACALDRKGGVWCWGRNDQGQLGTPSVSHAAAERVNGVETALYVITGHNRSCAVTQLGHVVCWGRFLRFNRAFFSKEPKELEGLQNVTQIAHGSDHLCARHNNGTVTCIGVHQAGQQGVLPAEPRETKSSSRSGPPSTADSPTLVPNVTDAQWIDAGEHFTCALQRSGTVSCWGANYGGQVGNGLRSQVAAPGPVVDLDDATFLSVGVYHACALRRNGEQVCWGYDAGYREHIGSDRPRRPSRIRPEPPPVPAAPTRTLCAYGEPLRVDLAAWQDEMRREAGNEDRRARLLSQLQLPPVPPDHINGITESHQFSPYKLVSLQVDKVPLLSGQREQTTVQLAFHSSYHPAGGWAEGFAFRAQVLDPVQTGTQLYCPVLAKPLVQDFPYPSGCGPNTLGLHDKAPYGLSFVSLLEAERKLIVAAELAPACGNQMGVTKWEQTFHRLTDGQLGPSLLTLTSESYWDSDSEAATEYETLVSFEPIGPAYPKRVLTAETTRGCEKNSSGDCGKPFQEKKRVTYQFNGQKYVPLKEAVRRKL